MKSLPNKAGVADKYIRYGRNLKVVNVTHILLIVSSRISFCLSLSPSLCRLFVFPLSGSHVHVQTQHVFCGSGPGEGGDRDVFPGRYPLPLLLLALPHSLLPLRGRVKNLLQVRDERFKAHTEEKCIYKVKK